MLSYNRISDVKTKKSIKPLEHQKLVTNFLVNKHYRGLIVFHSVGSGKTLTSLLSAKALLNKYPDKNVIIITPASLTTNYVKELEKVKMDRDPRIKVYSYIKFINKITGKTDSETKPSCSKNILIIDEAHHFGRNGVMTNTIKECARQAYKVLLLTATPIQNSPSELANLLYMISPWYITEKEIRERFHSYEYTNKLDEGLFLCKVSFFKNVDTQNYPSSKEHIIQLRMDRDYYTEYLKIQENYRENLPEIFQDTKDLEVFLNGIRRATNILNVISPKIQWVLDKIKKDNRKTLVYSNWKSAGIDVLKKKFKEEGIVFGEISGSIPKERKDKYIKDFNNGDTNILLITASGSEGLDLKGVRNVIILEPHWNESRIEQVIGRAIRYKSHSHLPKKERNVDIYTLILRKPEKLFKPDKIPFSGDEILLNLSIQKQKKILTFYKKLEKLSIENNKLCK